ncbi:hypothetical protein NOCA180166 [metagenome]|uniref:Uncharacterized protein n=1 Tax=metagenome TaxID=256318 RepID=A0A2P2CLD1_9ZZZZ
MAAATAVPDDVVGQHRPVALGEERPDSVLDLDRVGLLRPAEATHQPAEVGVDGDARLAERVAQDHVGRLATDAREGDQVVEASGHLAVEGVDQRLAELEQRVGLLPEEAQRAEELLHVLARCGRHRLGRGVGREQRRARRVDPPVGGLRGDHRDDQALERVGEVELGRGVGIGLGQDPIHPAGPPHEGRVGLGDLAGLDLGGNGHAASLRFGSDTPETGESQAGDRRETGEPNSRVSALPLVSHTTARIVPIPGA